MTVNQLISALRTLVDDCPQYGDVPVLIEVNRPDGGRDLLGCGFHMSDGSGDETAPQRLLLTVVDQNYEV